MIWHVAGPGELVEMKKNPAVVDGGGLLFGGASRWFG